MDEIKRRLALIDQQLIGTDFHNKIVKTCPLLFIAAGLITGILIQNRITLVIPIWMILLITFAIVGVVLFYFGNSPDKSKYAVAYIALSCFVCLGALRLSLFSLPRPDDIRKYISQDQTLATIRGLIISEPFINTNNQWKFSSFTPTDPTSSFYLNVLAVDTISGWRPAGGVIFVHVDEPVYDLRAGDDIQFFCWLSGFGPPSNPGQFDFSGYMARRNIFVVASIKSRDGITLLPKSPAGIFAGIRNKMKKYTTQALLGDVATDDTRGGLLKALLLGYRRDIDSDTYEAFRKTGLLHFISLSGMHLGILIGIVWWLCKTAGLMKPARAAVCAIAVCVFLLVVPPRAPTLRAAIICWVFCASFIFCRHSNPLNTLSLAAIILLLIRPTQLFEAGWQLSFTTILGIILFTEKIEAFISEYVPKESDFGILSKLRSMILRLFAVGFAAWLGGAGILLYHFYTITPLASIWTVMVFPLICIVLTLGFAKMILYYLLPTISSLLTIIVLHVSDVLIWLVKFIAQLNISEILIGHIPIYLIILYYLIIIVALYRHPRFNRLRKYTVTLLFLSLILCLGLTKYKRTYRSNLIMTCLDVGQGQAILVQLPGKSNILFDAGSMYKNNIGGRVIIPFLNYMGINKIDAVIISHNDIDHINGIPEIVEHCSVGNIYANDAFFDNMDIWGTAKYLEDCLTEEGFKIKRLNKDVDFKSGAVLNVLWPNEQTSENGTLSDNDKSLVTSVEFINKKILLCSDIEQYAQRQLMNLYPNLRADVMTIPHHGSANTLEEGFLERFDAKILICSCNVSQYERTDYTGALRDVKLFFTPKDGAVTVKIDKSGVITTRTYLENANPSEAK